MLWLTVSFRIAKVALTALTAVEEVLWRFQNAATRPMRPQTRRGMEVSRQALPEVVMLEMSRTPGVMLRGLQGQTTQTRS